MDWHFCPKEILSGAVGGLVYTIFKDEVFFPALKREGGVVKLFLGFIRAILLGAFVGFVVDTHPVFSALMGFSFNDAILAIQKRVKQWVGNGEEDVKR